MNVRNFVALSGALLACWLGVSYLRPVSQKHYPLIGKPAGAESTAGIGSPVATFTLFPPRSKRNSCMRLRQAIP